ncbi:hypothetical protein J2I47_09315 [Fibrella sp. HMF5335]|uniref:Uncharacterized protein n=1 Tax=Fibrella rubiginis TaxID=2817060 RepID=A0A939K136_9BACT|nr:hypothetical protein [Fibrella rubiginis]MBO0936742.1 hypothetical protein [Fibrella rubiginis]
MSYSPHVPTRTADRLVIGLIALLVALFYAAIYRYAINVPVVDDLLYIDSIRRITTPGTSLSEIARVLVEQHNDHRILLSRLIVLADYWLEGQVNYRTLALAGSLSVVGLLWQLYRIFREAALALWLVLPVALLLFQPSYQEDVWGVLCLLQHTVTLFLTVIVFRLLARPEPSAQMGALALGGLVLYSNSNGLFMWMAAVVLLLLLQRWRWAIAWVVAGVVFIGLYFGIDYTFVSKNSLATAAEHPGWIVKSILSAAGGAAYFDGRKWLLLPVLLVVMVLGTGVLLVIVVSWLRALLQTKKVISGPMVPFLGIAFVLLCSTGASALTRSDGGLMVPDRYQIFCISYLIVIYGLLILQLPKRWIPAVGLLGIGFTGWLWLNAWLYYGPLLSERYNRLVAEGMALKHYHYSVMSQTFGLDQDWQRRWEMAMSRGIYQVPDLPEIWGVEVALKAPPVVDSTTRFATRTERLGFLNSDALFFQQDTLPTPRFLFLRSVGNWYLLPAQSSPRPILKPWLPARGAKSMVVPVMLKPGIYQLGWIRQTPTGWHSTVSTQTIAISDRPQTTRATH